MLTKISEKLLRRLSNGFHRLPVEPLEITDVELSGLYIPDFLLRFPDGLVGVVQCVSEDSGRDEVTLLATYLLYDAKLLRDKDILMSPLLLVLSSSAERFDDVSEAIVRGVTTAERIMNASGDLSVLAVNTERLGSPAYVEQVVSRAERLLSDDAMRWDALKEKGY